ncbi:MAG: metallophosphoesterase family protein [Sedimentisphaerales bacterium]|nr:metallophosphoesterase family protein [Sedimentisphaerales bacterium]
MIMYGKATVPAELRVGRPRWHWMLAGMILLTLPVVGYAKITKGPMLLRVYQDRAAVMWETDAAGSGKVFYGKVPEKQGAGESAVVLEKQVESDPIDIDYKYEEKDHRVYIHKVWLENLKSGVAYEYAIVEGGSAGTGAGRYGSGPHRFRTVPKHADAVRFAVYGDSRSFPDRHRKIVEQIMKAKVDFVVNSGDLVGSGMQYQQWSDEFFEPMRGLAESVPIYAAKGNHDKSSQDYFEKLLVPPGEKNHFGFEYGPVSYWCGDQYVAKPGELLGLMARYFKGKTGQWNFVSFHEPCLNFGAHDSAWGYPNALQRILEMGVDFLVVGHSHLYERFRPFCGKDKDGSVSYLTSITSGGGGAPTHGPYPVDLHAAANEEYHFCLFEIKGNLLTMQEIDLNGKVIDSFKVSKVKGRLDPEYVSNAVPVEEALLVQSLQHKPPLAKPVAAKDEPFWIFYAISLPNAKSEVKIDLELIFDPDKYEIKQPKQSVVVGLNETVKVKFLAKGKQEVEQNWSNPGPITPAIWLSCEYKSDQWEGSVKLPVKGERKFK